MAKAIDSLDPTHATCNSTDPVAALAGVAGVYNKALYLAERRQALELWGAHVTALVEARSSKIAPLRQRPK